ncbi:unnamed protein product [Rotaria magnacalcarata]|uniref:Uncharacterized protein n=1 Tax=Rotaria magnacalcarata TaxID=392030 RepID=A0A819CCB7_9BILA|nr:unnamed protein product [Rotaria magnacalcarata]CAF3815601.1 unnamed protein product [Rotaria magnacalcarata]
MASNDSGSGIRLVAFDDQQKLTAPIRNATSEPVTLFQELSPCISFIEQQTKEKKIVILITTVLEDNLLQTFESLAPIEAILISSTIEIDIDTLPTKVIDVYYQPENLLRSLTELLDAIEMRINVGSFLFNHQTDASDNLSFYFYNLWKNYVENPKSTKKSLIDQARLIFSSNNQIKGSIQQFESSYKPNVTLTWLDRQRYPFPYHVLISNALRSHNKEILSLTRCFIDDLTKQMKPATTISNCKQVYLGTKISMNLIEQFEQRVKTDIVAFQCFLRVTQSRANALVEATQPSRRRNWANVLFKIDMNDALCASSTEAIIIDMATPFKILCVTRSTGANNTQQLLTIIKLSALNKNERDKLFQEFIQQQEKLGRTINDLLRRMGTDISDDEALADEYKARGEWSQAADSFARITDPNVRVLNKYGCLLQEHLYNPSNALRCHQQALLKANDREHAETLVHLGVVYKSMKQHAESFKVYSQALEWFENEEERDPTMIACCLIGLGTAHWSLQKLPEALECMEKALAIREHEVKPKNELDIATCVGNISNILHDQGDIERSLSYAIRTADLLSKCGKDDTRFAAALNNLGAIYRTKGDFVKAREYFERALKSLPDEKHPYRRSALANITALETIEKMKK